MAKFWNWRGETEEQSSPTETSLSKATRKDGALTGEDKVYIGVWVQTIGQLLEAVGATKQHLASNQQELTDGLKVAIQGNWLQGLGSSLEAVGESQILMEMKKGIY